MCETRVEGNRRKEIDEKYRSSTIELKASIYEQLPSGVPATQLTRAHHRGVLTVQTH
jgi:hypothetical protein